MGLPRSGLRDTPVARDEHAALARRVEELAGTHPRFGYRRIWALLVREGWSVNKKAVRRIWRLSGLTQLPQLGQNCTNFQVLFRRNSLFVGPTSTQTPL